MNSLIWTGAGGHPADMLFSQNDTFLSLSVSVQFLTFLGCSNQDGQRRMRKYFFLGHVHTERYLIPLFLK